MDGTRGFRRWKRVTRTFLVTLRMTPSTGLPLYSAVLLFDSSLSQVWFAVRSLIPE